MTLIGEAWMKWTLLEACTKTASKVLQKVVGNVSSTVAHTFFATFVVGLVQVVSGYIACRRRKTKIMTDWQSILGACLFGCFAVISTVLGFAVFLLGGDMSINTFFITLSIVPGALIDRFCFGHKLESRAWIGVLVAILAGYAILDWPSLQEVIKMPLWVWLSIATMFSVAINQGITQKVKKIDMFVKNFWGGLTAVILGGLGVIILGQSKLFIDFSVDMRKLWIVSIAIGFIVVAMWSYNLLSYKGGASIALKKLVMNGAYLIMVMILGVPLFHEKFTWGKVTGTLLFLAAFVLMDKSTWEFVTRTPRTKPAVVTV